MFEPEQPYRLHYTPRRARRPFVRSVGVLLALFVLLVPVVRLFDRDSGQVIKAGELPGGAISGQPLVTATTAATTPPTTAAPVAAAAAPPATAAPQPTAAGPSQQALAAAAAKKAAAAAAAQKAAAAAAKKAAAEAAAKNAAAAAAAAAAKKAAATTAPKPKPAPPPPPPPPPPPAKTYTQAEVESIIRQVWPADLADEAVRIAYRESKLIPTVHNYCCYGVFAIYYEAGKKFLNSIGVMSAEQLFDPWVNVRAAYELYKIAGWQPWSL